MKINKNAIQMKAINLMPYILLISLLISCGSQTPNVEEINTTEAVSDITVITPAQFELGEMEFGAFSNQPFHRVINSTGMLDVPPENKSTVTAYFGGYVKGISLLEGQKINKGQTLFTLENPDYIQVQQKFLEAKSQLTYLKSDYERQKELAKDKVNAEKTLLKAESDYHVMLVRYESLKKKLQLMNINTSKLNETNLRSTIAVKAPISGYVTSVLATTGMFLNPSDIALTIMNTEHLHVELKIFEQDLTKVAIGQEVAFGLQNNPIQYKATIHLINKAIDPVNRTVNIHCHLVNENKTAQFTPGMYVEAKIYATSDSILALPTSAVIEIEGKHYILIKINETADGFELERKEVQIGRSNNEYVEITTASAFSKQTEILTKGAFNLIQE